MDIRHLLLLFPILGLSGATTKKGVSLTRAAFLCDDFEAMTDISWWYDWGPSPFKFQQVVTCDNIDQYMEMHIGMIFAEHFFTNNLFIDSRSQYVLAYNEPNHQKQANMTVAEGVSYWPEVESNSNGTPIVSPAAAPCGANCVSGVYEWFDDFFATCNGCRVDYLATHYYKCKADKTMEYLEDLYNRYGLKIWLTEFACPITTNASEQLEYMTELLPQLEAAEFVYRYAWFLSRKTSHYDGEFITTSATLLEADSSTPTALGRYYFGYTTDGTTTDSTTTDSTTTDNTGDNTTSGTTSTSENCSATCHMLGYIFWLILDIYMCRFLSF